MLLEQVSWGPRDLQQSLASVSQTTEKVRLEGAVKRSKKEQTGSGTVPNVKFRVTIASNPASNKVETAKYSISDRGNFV